MKIVVAGKDRTNDLGPAISDDAQRRGRDPRCLFLDWSVNALSLSDAKSEEALLDKLHHLTRHKNHVDTRVYDIPRKPGLAGGLMACFKKFLWKLLRYQHDRVAFRQNLINSDFTALVEFQRDEIKKLAARVAELERGSR